MLNKFLANLPFNPSLVNQLAFYGKRLRAESSIRRIGFAFVGLALVVQIFAVISPPQSSLAASSNDLINGGFTSAAEAASDCTNNVQTYATILANYGITCAKVAAAPTITIHSTDFNRQLFSMGSTPYPLPGETTVVIPGTQYTNYYARYLWGWDTGPPSTYQALNVTSTGGQTFLLLYNCGNLTSVGLPVPVQKPPSLSINKTTLAGYPIAGSTVAPGTTLGWRIFFNNSGGTAQNVIISDPSPANTTFTWAGSGAATTYGYNSSTRTTTWQWSSIPAGASGYYTDLEASINPGVPNGTQICNIAGIASSQTPVITSNSVCVTVQSKAPPPVVTPTTTTPPVVTPPTPPANCSTNLSSENPLACVSVHKTADNLTQGLPDAQTKPAQAGDTILYTLFAQNTGQGTVKNYVFTEDLSDVLDYSTVNNLYGGTMNQLDQVTWPAVDIKAGATASVQVSVNVDNPIPQTPPSSSNPEGFNHIMTNVYGNTININLPTPLPQATIQATNNLVNTGPGSSLLIAGGVTVVVGYFFARARLLAKETDIVRRDAVIAGNI